MAVEHEDSKQSSTGTASVPTVVIEETTPLLATGQQDLYRAISHKSSQDVEQDAEYTNQDQAHQPEQRKNEASVFGIISVLLIGVFVSSADYSLVMATFAQISSEFGQLESGSWLLSSYLLASCVTQPMVCCLFVLAVSVFLD